MHADTVPEWVQTRRRTIGTRIRAGRLDADLTQMALADLCDVDHKTIHRIEYATADPSLGLLLRIADAIGVPLADLVRQ
ncbi:helix-turn-helix transcriptional regulator [Streptomyces sp. NPDC057910]|uniref:helix-turn-helix transcriptional regulator n=1 Tax=Streptomyces sp. NPDC057910 TaxID=3346278 RepID=UPI0036E2FEFA